MADVDTNESLAAPPDGTTHNGAAMSADELQKRLEYLEQLVLPRTASHERLLRGQNNASNSTKALTRDAFGELMLSIEAAQGIIADVFHRLDGKRWSAEGDNLKRHLLLASFASNMALIEALTAQGMYVSASTLVRQQMEGLAELEGIEAGKPRRKDKTANVGLLRWKLSKAYGSQSDIAHNDPDKLFQLLAQEQTTAKDVDSISPAEETDRPTFSLDLYPRFIEGKAKQLLAQQACLALIVSAHALSFMQDVSNEVVSDHDVDLIQFLGWTLEKQGIVEPATKK